MSRSVIPHVWQRLLCISFFAIAMGLLEAICVVYLRRIIIPGGVADGQAVALPGPLPIEQIREACTLILLLTVAWLAAFNWLSRVAAFFFMFGVWDITYYAGLKWLVNWPSSLLEWDCLFLIPKPWYGPVLAPVLISGYFVIASGLVLVRESFAMRLRPVIPVISLYVLALAVWYWSFVKDSDRIMAYGYAGVTYSWLLFACGLASAIVGLWIAARQTRAS